MDLGFEMAMLSKGANRAVPKWRCRRTRAISACDLGIAAACVEITEELSGGSDEAKRLTAKTAVGAANCGYFSRVLRGALWGSWRVSAGLSWGGTGGGGRTRILWDRGQPALRVWRGAPGPFYLRNHFSWIIGLDRNSSRPVTPSLVPGLTVR